MCEHVAQAQKSRIVALPARPRDGVGKDEAPVVEVPCMLDRRADADVGADTGDKQILDTVDSEDEVHVCAQKGVVAPLGGYADVTGFRLEADNNCLATCALKTVRRLEIELNTEIATVGAVRLRGEYHGKSEIAAALGKRGDAGN
jgi:hypothetical protein